LLKETMKGDDADAIRKSFENLMTASQTIGKIMYEEAAKQGGGVQGEAGAASGGESADGGGKKDDDVIDAEYEVKES